MKTYILKLHITFLAELPDVARLQSIADGNYLPDEFSVIGQTIYLSCPNGYGNTKLSNSFFEHKLKVKATTRNLKTCSELLKMAELLQLRMNA